MSRETGRVGTSTDGRSIWCFLLLGIEAIRQHRIHPFVVVRGQPTIPTWTAPIALLLAIAVLMPGSSALGHLCGLAIGYLCALRPLPLSRRERDTNSSSWSWIHQIPGAPGLGAALD